MIEESKVVVLDNGGGLLKAGFSGDADPVAIVPNCIGRPPSHSSKKWLVADQLQADGCDLTGVSIRRPIDRGYLINPDVEKEVWDRVLRSLLKVEPSNSSLLLVEPLLNPASLQRSTDELIFEEFGFKSLYVADSPSLVHQGSGNGDCSLVVDCGFSFTHAAPVVQNMTLNYAVKRMDLGGKALTNYLKELVSYRSLNVMDETLLIDHAKEELCFVSLDLPRDLRLSSERKAGNVMKCTYVLPDGITHTKGFVKDRAEAQRYLSLNDATQGALSDNIIQQVVDDADNTHDNKKMKIDANQNEFVLTNERFLVPEMLFHPADLGMNQAGLAECIVRSVNSCHPYLHPLLFDNIILTGGSTLFPGFAERLERELRPLVPHNYKVKIRSQENPIVGVWKGGSVLGSSPHFESMCVTKSEYQEIGSARCRRRFFH